MDVKLSDTVLSSLKRGLVDKSTMDIYVTRYGVRVEP